MRPTDSRGWWHTNTGETGGGRFEEQGVVKEALLDHLRAGPGEAARQEVAVGDRCPTPCRWTLRTLRMSVDGLREFTVSGVWRVLQTCGLTWRAPCARLFSPDPDY